MSGANLSWAKLYNANFSNADLQGLDLSFANFSRANLRHSNLSNAVLEYASEMITYPEADIEEFIYFTNFNQADLIEPAENKAKELAIERVERQNRS